MLNQYENEALNNLIKAGISDLLVKYAMYKSGDVPTLDGIRSTRDVLVSSATVLGKRDYLMMMLGTFGQGTGVDIQEIFYL